MGIRHLSGIEGKEIFADNSDVNEIGKWLRRNVLDSVTTNPSIMLKDGVRDMEKAAREIAEIVGGRPVSVEEGVPRLRKRKGVLRVSSKMSGPSPALESPHLVLMRTSEGPSSTWGGELRKVRFEATLEARRASDYGRPSFARGSLAGVSIGLSRTERGSTR